MAANTAQHEIGVETHAEGDPVRTTAGAPGPLPNATYDDTGVDISLLRWILAHPPVERLLMMERHARDVMQLMDYGRQHREAEAAANR
jgi:hypothetical protein